MFFLSPALLPSILLDEKHQHTISDFDTHADIHPANSNGTNGVPLTRAP